SSTDQSASLFQAKTGKQINVLHEHGLLGGASFSPDGRRIVIWWNDGIARLYDGETGEEVGVLRGHKENVIKAVFSPDGSRVLTLSGDSLYQREARLWSATSQGERMATTLFTLGSFLSADGKTVAAAAEDGLHAFDIPSGDEVASVPGD